MNILKRAAEAIGLPRRPAEMPVADSKEVANVRNDAGKSALYIAQKAEFDGFFGGKSKWEVIKSLTNIRDAKGADYGTYGTIQVGEGVTVDGKECLVYHRVSRGYPRSKGMSYSIYKIEVKD